ncbi:MAG: hypothetical protein ABJA64_02400 [Candidatus Saccharibacteria bacterium]
MQQDNEPTVTREAKDRVVSSTVVRKTTKSDSQKNDESGKSSSSAGIIVLQWLSYAFWGWLIAALIWLVSITLTNAIAGGTIDGVIPYAMASAIVLLPIAFVTDLFYRKHEPRKKEGAATVIMVIHAVLFALIGIGSLIVTVFIGLSMLIGSGGSNDLQTISLLVMLFAAVMYGLVFVRIINPFKTSKAAAFYGFGMLILTTVLLILGTAGPMVKSISLRDDRRIEKSLPDVENAVSNYIQQNKKLPDDLNSLEYSRSDAKALVSDGLVTYKKEIKVSDDSTSLRSYNKTEFRYQLCVTYNQKSSKSSYSSYNSSDYRTSVSTYGHGAGEVCYKLEKSVYDYSK